MYGSILAPQFSGSTVSFTQNRADNLDKACPSVDCLDQNYGAQMSRMWMEPLNDADFYKTLIQRS